MLKLPQVSPIEGSPIMAITVEAMTLYRQEARPRLRDLEIIFYQMAIMTSSKTSASATSPTELPGQAKLHKNKDNSELASESEEAEFKRQTNIPSSGGGTKKGPYPTEPPVRLTLSDVYSLKKRLTILAAALVLVALLVLGGVLCGRRSVIRKHFQQGPLQMFTCYSGHTHAIRTLDLRNVYCPECGDHTSPSFTCQKCGEIYGLTLWPKRDMSEEECEKFEEKLSVCPYCQSENISPTPAPSGRKKK